MRTFIILLIFSLRAIAGQHDYYECIDARGAFSQSIEPCKRGDNQKRIANDKAPVTVKLDTARGGLVRLESVRGNHFITQVKINGVVVRAMVDTGASMVAISPNAANRVGLYRLPFRMGWTQTANGVSPARYVVLKTVDLGGNVVQGVESAILQRDLGRDFDVLLGMSFLKHFEVNTGGGVMTFQPR